MKKRSQSPLSARQRLATQLRMRRKVLGISQEALADLANIHRTYVGAVERSERNVSIDNIEKLAKALDADVSELLKDPEQLTQ